MSEVDSSLEADSLQPEGSRLPRKRIKMGNLKLFIIIVQVYSYCWRRWLVPKAFPWDPLEYIIYTHPRPQDFR